MPSNAFKPPRRRPAMAIARVTALPVAIAVMAATVALSPSEDTHSTGEPAVSTRAFLASFSAHGATPAAVTNLNALFGEQSTDSNGKLDYTLFDGSPAADLQHTLVHKNDGSFFLALWRAGSPAAGQSVPVTVTFGQPVHKAEEINPSIGLDAQQAWAAPQSVTMPVGDDLVVLKILPGASAPATTAVTTPPASGEAVTPVTDTTPITAAAIAASPAAQIPLAAAGGPLRVDAGGAGDSLRQADSAAASSPYLVSKANTATFDSPTTVDTADPSVPADTPSSIFQSERWSSTNSLGYDVPVPNGRFLIRLYTAETYAPAQKVGGRLMDVGIEGATLQRNLDTFAHVGANRGYVTNYVTTVTDGVLSLRLTTPTGSISPHLDAFDVIPLETDLSHPVTPVTGGGQPPSGTGATEPITAGPRDAWLRPFTSHSIWNMPIGSDAQYVPAGIPAAGNGVNFDQVYVVKTTASDAARSWLLPGSWTDRCAGSVSTGTSINLPDDFLVADAHARSDGGWDTPNYAGVFLRPDGRYADNTSAVARCTPGGPIYGYKSGDPAKDVTDLYGDGRLGSHGASGLSALGGLIRPGELSGTEPIHHALDLVLWAKYLNYGSSKGFRWPAVSADAYASSSTYAGSNPATKMGSLLALPPGVTPESAGITSPVALKIFRALQDYGGYITDDAAWDSNYISIDRAALGTFTWGAAEQAQVNKLISMLSVVDNNTASNVGGGGTPRQPLLPELKQP